MTEYMEVDQGNIWPQHRDPMRVEPYYPVTLPSGRTIYIHVGVNSIPTRRRVYNFAPAFALGRASYRDVALGIRQN
jgi:hypothetical protein